jgi:hypothetical protein
MKEKSAMKIVEKLLIWSYFLTSVIQALPITSKPLENNLDHLIREVEWFSHGTSRHDFNRNGPLPGASKKITPKSIFITPNFNNLTSQLCAPGFKIDEKGQCIQVISINQEDLLVTRLQSILSQTTDNAENGIKVDYYDYDEDNSESNEFPYQVNLPLTINTENFNTEDDEKILESFFDKPTTEKFHQKQSTISNNYPESIEFVSFDKRNNFTTDESSGTNINAHIEPHHYVSSSAKYEQLPNSTNFSTVFGENISNTERLNTISDKIVPLIDVNLKNDTTLNINNTEVEYLFDNINNNLNSTTTKIYSIMPTDGEDDIINTSNNASAFNGTTKENKNEFYSDDIVENIELTSESPTTETVDLIIDDNDENITTADLLEDLDESGNFTSEEIMTSSSNDFISSSNDIEITTEDMSGDGSGDSTLTATSIDFVSENPNSMENFNLKVANETEKNKVERNNIVKQEEKYDTLDENDSSNRFVYHHLPFVNLNNSQISTSENPSSIHQMQTNQVELVHKIVEETKKEQQNVENRVRFPNLYEELNNHPLQVTKSEAIKFPGEATNRFPVFKSVTNNNEFKTEKLPKNQNLPTSTSSFWFMQNGFDGDKTDQKPPLLKFWSRMPLIRDPALFMPRQNIRNKVPSPIYLQSHNYQKEQQDSENPQFLPQSYRNRYNHRTTTNKQSYRENSKSPGENFYKEVSAQDNYKVIPQRNYQYSNRR